MSRVLLRPIKSRKQLRKIAFKDVISAGFTDDSEKFFVITFNTENGTKVDLSVVFFLFLQRTYISEEYKD